MSQGPTILVNGKPLKPAPGATLSHTPPRGPQSDWALASPAGFFERGLAKWADYLFTGIIVLILEVFSVSELMALILVGLLQAHLMQSPLGASVGKWLLGLRLVSTREEPLTYGRAFLRIGTEASLPILAGMLGGIFAAVITKSLGVLLAIGGFVLVYGRPLFHPRRHAFHDTFAGTEVVRPGESRVLFAMAMMVLSLVGLWNFKDPLLERMAREEKAKPVAPFVFNPADGRSENPCLITPYCLTVYVTPWCPACEQTKPTLKRIQSVFNDGRVGVQVIMGQDQAAKLQAACAEYGSGCGLDADETILKSLKIRSFPTYLLWDTSSRKRIKKPRAFQAPETLSAEEFKRVASDKLGIPSP